MLKQKQFEDTIKTSLHSRADKISPPDNMFEKIKSEVQLNRSEKRFMLKEKFLPLNLNLKKSIIVASCGMLIIGGTVLTFSPDTRVSALQSINKYANGYIDMKGYDKSPSKAELKKDLGYEVKVPASLEGGYKLLDSAVSGHIDGSNPDKQYDKKEIGATYSKNNTRESSIMLSAWKVGAKEDSPIYKNAKIVKISNTTAYWTEYTVHVLPNTIKLSKEQEDKETKACKEGKEILVGIGSKNGKKLKEEFNTTHSLKWTENNVNYELTDENNKLTFEQMSKIAESIMNSK